MNLDSVLSNLKPAQVPWNDEIKKSVVHHMVTNVEFYSTYRDYFPPSGMSDRVHERMLSCVGEHFEAHSKLPSLHIMREKMRVAYRQWPDDWPSAEAQIFEIYEYVECETDMGYIENLIVEYSKREGVKRALRESYELVHSDAEDRFEKIETLIREATSMSVVKDGFVNYAASAPVRLLNADLDEYVERFGGGFQRIDSDLGGGIKRGEIVLAMGDSGTGKSQLLTHIAGHNVVMGKKTLYVSVENSEEVVNRRFDALFSMISMKEVVKRRGEVASKIAGVFGQNENLRVRCYPMGSVSVADIAAETEKHAVRTGWRPDVVVLDYLDEIKEYQGLSNYDSQGLIIRDFRSWMQKITAGGFTATQANRNASTAGIVTRAETGDSYWKIRRSDAVWTLNCDREEGPRGLMRIYVDKSRNSAAGYVVYVKKDFSRCLFVEISRDEYERIMGSPI
jgi:energy-coupling factor transporter ATP-binding protein EcfA2